MSLSTLFGRWTGSQEVPVASTKRSFPDPAAAPLDTRRLIRDRRYCQILSPHLDVQFDSVSVQCAWEAFEFEMAYVPAGCVRLICDSVVQQGRGYELSQGDLYPVETDSFYLDRECVTNEEFSAFVDAGGYQNTSFWPQDLLPWVLQFVDATGEQGPRFWNNGKPPADLLNHPVVGISWYEASAFAMWVGKRLPSSAEWQRAGTWHHGHSAQSVENRYPWGNAFRASCANLWRQDFQLEEVDAYKEGNTPNGVYQLIGNVWEWVDAEFNPAPAGETRVLLDETMAEVRGGAFDTYFPTQATCQFRTGNPILARPANVGFRCCISSMDIQQPSQELPQEDNHD